MSYYLQMQRRAQAAEREKAQRPDALEERRRRLAAVRNAPRERINVLPAPPMALNPAVVGDTSQQPEAVLSPESQPTPSQYDPTSPYAALQRPRRRRKRPASASPRKSFGEKVQISSTLLGTGAFGSVYLGVHQETGMMVAVKKIALTPTMTNDTNSQIDEIVGEVNLMKSLKHPNIVDYYHAERRDGHLWIYLEFMSGGSLASLLKKFDVLSESVMRVYLIQILQGMHYLHSKNVVHRDIKADNILLSGSGEAKLSDFGTSREFSDSHNLLSVAGTPWFMAPEVVKGVGHGAAADMWSLACTVIHLTTGVVPFGSYENPVTTMFQIAMHPEKVHEAYENSELSEELKAVIRACLQEEPALRATPLQLLEMPFFDEERSSSDEEDPEEGVPAGAVQYQARPPSVGVPQPVPLHASRNPQAAGAPARPGTPPGMVSRLRDQTQNQQMSSVVSGGLGQPRPLIPS